MKKILLLFVLFFNLIPVIRDDGFSLFFTASYAQSFGEETDPDEECERTELTYIGQEDCYDVYFELTVITKCESGEFVDQSGIDIRNYIDGCEEGGGDETDCAGVVGGSAYEADCGCIGGTTGIINCPEDEDCNGDPGGSAYEAECGCIGGNTGIYDCPSEVDCNGVEGGTAYTDECQTCVGGNTGRIAQTWFQDLDGDGWGSSVSKSCFNPGPGWVLQAGDLNDDCYNVLNIVGQCCDQVSKNKAAQATLILNKSVVQNQINQLAPITESSNEQGFSIRKNTNGTYSVSAIQTIGTAGGTINSFPNSEADFHTHPINYAPSALDLFGLHYLHSQIPDFTTRYVKSENSTFYALTITDATLFNTFVSNHPNFVGPDDGFAAGSVLGLGYQDAFNMFSAQGLTTEDAANHATAFVLKDSGVILLRGDGSSTTLKKIGAEIKLDANGNPVLNAEGKKVYVKSDCP